MLLADDRRKADVSRALAIGTDVTAARRLSIVGLAQTIKDTESQTRRARCLSQGTQSGDRSLHNITGRTHNMSAVIHTTRRSIPLGSIVTSQSEPQIARRKRFEQADLDELAESIKQHGLVNPILVRPHPAQEVINGEAFELVAGERRYLAAKRAGLDEIDATVRELSDQQVLELQLIENLQRVDLHPLQEAEGYEQLLKHGHKAEELGDKVGKSRRYVYARIQLLKMGKAARDAFYAGDLSASTALLVARIPGHEAQERALKHITEKDWQGRVMSLRDAQRYVHETFMLKLSEAPFNREDGTLVPNAGPCGPCPMRTGNAPDLFGDVKGADVCTNPSCFASKKAAHIKRELEKATAAGDKVIRGSEAKRILPDTRGYSYSSDGSHKQLRNGFARPSDKCLDDPKKRTYAELAGKDAPRVMLQNPSTGRVEKIFKIEDITDRLKAKGIKPSPPAQDRQQAREQDREQQKKEQAIEVQKRRAVFKAAFAAAPTKLSHDDLATLLSRTFEIGFGDDEDFFAALNLEPPKKGLSYNARPKYFFEQLRKQSAADLARYAVVLTVIDDVLDSYGDAKELNALAKRLGVDVKKVHEDAIPSAAKDHAKAKASKKKAAKR
jgi:ParB/RepB/Spo0J family partition protein